MDGKHVRLQLVLPAGLTVEEANETLFGSGSGLAAGGGGRPSDAYFSQVETFVEIAMLVTSVGPAAFSIYQLKEAIVKRRREAAAADAAAATAADEPALIIDGTRYPLSAADAAVIKELIS